MGIDGISKKGPTPPTAPTPSEAGTKATFVVGGPSGPVPTTVGPLDEASRAMLDGVRKGDVTLDAFVEHRIETATAHLRHLPPGQLEGIRAELRSRMVTDPSLVELLRQATGQVLPADPE